MEMKAKKSRLAGIPAWAFSLITLFVPLVLFELFEHSQLPKPVDTDLIFIIGYVIYVTAACFLICRTHPKSVWYTPLICNGFLIVFAMYTTDPTELIVMISIFVLSVIAAIVGARIGRLRINLAK
jgi:hypothetical protein